MSNAPGSIEPYLISVNDYLSRQLRSSDSPVNTFPVSRSSHSGQQTALSLKAASGRCDECKPYSRLIRYDTLSRFGAYSAAMRSKQR